MKIPVKVLYSSYLPSVKDRDKILRAKNGMNLLNSIPDDYLNNLDKMGNGTPFPNYTPNYSNPFDQYNGLQRPYEAPGTNNQLQPNTDNYHPYSGPLSAPNQISPDQSLGLTAPDNPPEYRPYEGQVGKAIVTAGAAFDSLLPYGKINRWPTVRPDITPNQHPYGTGSQALMESGGELAFFDNIRDSGPRARLENGGGIALLDSFMDMDRAKLAYGGNIPEAKSGWIQKAVNPAHKGYCTPMTKATCTPHRKALAKTFKKHHGFHEDGGMIELKSGGSLSSSKAAEILHDGTAHGHALTPKQRRFMGWKAGNKAPSGSLLPTIGNTPSTNLPYTPQSRTDAYLLDDINGVLKTGTRTRNTGYSPQQQQLLTDAYIWKQKNPRLNVNQSIQNYFNQPVDLSNPIQSQRARLSKIGGDPLSMYNTTPNADVRMASGGNIDPNIQTHWGGNAKMISYNPYDGGTTQFNGNSHEQGGIGISTNGKKIEAEVQGGETSTLQPNGDRMVHGNIVLPATNIKMQNVFKEIAKKEVDMDKLKTKGTNTVLSLDPKNKFDQIRMNAGELMMKGGDMGQRQLAETKQNLTALEQAMLDTAKELNIKPDEMSRGNIVKAKRGMNIKKYPDGGKFRNPFLQRADPIVPIANDPNAVGRFQHNYVNYGPNVSSAPTSLPTAAPTEAYYPEDYIGDDPSDTGNLASVSDRHNNPGNIKFDVDANGNPSGKYAKLLAKKYGATKGQYSAIDNDYFAYFPTREAGKTAMKNLLTQGDNYKNLSVEAAINRWTKQKPYDLKGLGNLLGKKVSSLSPDEQNTVLGYMTKGEGTRYGVPNTPATGTGGGQAAPVPTPGGLFNNTPVPGGKWTPPAYDFKPDEPIKKPAKAIPTNDKLEYIGPKPVPPTQAKGLDFNDVASDIFAIAQNQERPVYAQKYSPDFYQPYQVSFQDRINDNNSSFRNTARLVGSTNPEALGSLAGAQYRANDAIRADEFRTNQGISNQVYNENIGLSNEAKRFNLGIADQQFVRQDLAGSKTREMNQVIVNSLSDKYNRNKANNNALKAYENLYNFRLQPNEQGGLSEINYNGYQNFGYQGPLPGSGGPSNVTRRSTYDANGNLKGYIDRQGSDLQSQILQLQLEKKQRDEQDADLSRPYGRNGLKIKAKTHPRKMFGMGAY